MLWNTSYKGCSNMGSGTPSKTLAGSHNSFVHECILLRFNTQMTWHETPWEAHIMASCKNRDSSLRCNRRLMMPWFHHLTAHPLCNWFWGREGEFISPCTPEHRDVWLCFDVLFHLPLPHAPLKSASSTAFALSPPKPSQAREPACRHRCDAVIYYASFAMKT